MRESVYCWEGQFLLLNSHDAERVDPPQHKKRNVTRSEYQFASTHNVVPNMYTFAVTRNL